MSGNGLELRGLARRFGRRWVLRGLDLDASPGQVIVVTGRNGSGKTTLLRVCATLLRPTRGSGRLFGNDLVKDAAEVREHVGMLAHDAGLYPNLTARENLEFAQRMTGRRVDRKAILAALGDVGLQKEQHQRVVGFSAGMRRRLALARLLLRQPSLLLLDEPYASFDVDGIELVNAFAARVTRAGGIAMVATHDLRRAEPVLDREVRIEDGRFVERSNGETDTLVPLVNGGAS